MNKLCYYSIAVLSGWLLVSPFLLRYDDTASSAYAIGAAAVCAVVALAGASTGRTGPSRLTMALGALLAAWGLVACFMPNAAGPNELITGLLWSGLSLLTSKIHPADEMVAYDIYGNPMATITRITIKDGNIAAKAVLLGSMPATMYLRPEEVWKALGMISWDTIVGLPRFLITGARRANSQTAKTKVQQ